MPRLHAIELLPDAAGAEACRSDWQALRDDGLPSMLDHAGDTNTPHVTVLALPAIDADLEARAVELLGACLPASVTTSGLAVLGGRRPTLARLLAVDDRLLRAVVDLRAEAPDDAHPGWLAHLTLARRLERGDLGRAVEVVDRPDRTLLLTGLRRWDPDAGEVRDLLDGGEAGSGVDD